MRRTTAALIYAFFVGQHFQLTSIADFPITIGLISGAALVVLLIRPSGSIVPVVSTLLAGSYFLIVYLLASQPPSLVEFARTFSLVLFAVFTLGLAWTGSIKHRYDARSLDLALLLALATIVGLSALQVWGGSRGSETFFNPYGAHQYLYQYEPHLAFNPIPRAHGFFLEPSYNAFVIGTVGVLLVMRGYRRAISSSLTVVGLLLAQSAMGLGMLAGLATLAFIATKGVPRLVGMVSLLGLIALSGTYLTDRAQSLAVQGSSANYRLIAPWQVLEQVLSSSIFGLPLGGIEQTISSFRLRNGVDPGSTLDNGFYVIIYYAGWVGIFFLLMLLFTAIGASRSQSKVRSGFAWIAPLWLFGTLGFSGGVLLPEFVITTFMVLTTYRIVAKQKDREKWTKPAYYRSSLSPSVTN